jgi:homoserine trans-succinylase
MPKYTSKKVSTKIPAKMAKVISKSPTQVRRVTVPKSQNTKKTSSKKFMDDLCENYPKVHEERFEQVRSIIQDIT